MMMNKALELTKPRIFGYIGALVFILLMVGSSEFFDHHEIILPEIAAMLVGMWAFREEGWIRKPLHIFLVPSGTAIIGFGVNMLAIPYEAKIIVTIVMMFVFMRIVQSGLAPALATGLLPVVTNATHWSFIASVVIFSIVIMVAVLVFNMNKDMSKEAKVDYKYMVVFMAIAIPWAVICWIAGLHLAVLPPILVVVYESLQKKMYMKKMAIKQGATLTISATVGTILYKYVDNLVVGVAISMILMFALVQLVKIPIPAVFAFPLLMPIFPEEQLLWFPPMALVTSIVLLGATYLYKQNEMKRKKATGEMDMGMKM